jgi:cysteine-S-conjugate beta-lyase
VIHNYNFDKIVDRRGTDCEKYDALKLYFGTNDAIPLWVADMDFKTPAFILEAMQKRLNHGIMGYPIRPTDFYPAIINWCKERHQWSVKREFCVFSPGVVPSINIAIQALTQEGDKIIVQSPVYTPFFTCVEKNNRKVLINELILKDGRYVMDYDDLEKQASEGAKMILLCTPHNPGGRVWQINELLKLAEIALKYNIIVISDEIHCDLVYKPNKHIPFALLSSEIAKQTVTLIAPSKTFNVAGLGASAAIIENTEMRQLFKKQIEKVHIGMGNVFGNLAMKEAYSQGSEYVDALMNYLLENVNYVNDYINKYTPKIKVMLPEATFLIWLDCRALCLNDNELQEFFLKKAGLALNPGTIYGRGGNGFMRLNIGCSKSLIIKALDELKLAYAPFY